MVITIVRTDCAERVISVFVIGDYVVCGSKGVCVVENKTTLNLSGIDSAREYYILKPVYVSGSTFYMPVDTSGDSMRKVLSREQAKELIYGIKDIPLIDVTNDKLLEQEYRWCIKANCCEELIKVIKTIYLRKQKRLEAGRKVTAVDAKYFRMAEDTLYGELAVSLGMPRESVGEYIAEVMETR